MGLDMYLIAKKFMKWNEFKLIKKKIEKLFPEIKNSELQYVIFEVGYWRKANAIHKWFVDNVQEGNDDCKYYYVNIKQLLKLKELCEEVIKKAIIEKGKIKNKEEISKLLPTQDGFFFGGTNYDNYYLDEIKHTIEIIDKCLKLLDDWEFEYCSSW